MSISVNLINVIYDWFLKQSTWRNLVAALLAVFTISALFNWRTEKLIQYAVAQEFDNAPQAVNQNETEPPADPRQSNRCKQAFDTVMKANKTMDADFCYTSKSAGDFASSVGPEGIRFYAITEVTMDMAFPLAYSFLSCILLARLWKPSNKWLVILPLLAACFDVIENTLLAWYSFQFFAGGAPEFVISTAIWFTRAKFFFLIATSLAIIVGTFVVREQTAEH